MNRVQVLRSSTSGALPTAGARLPGEVFANFPDLQLGVIDGSKNPQKLIAVRFFSVSANYAIGDFVVQAGSLYVANSAVTAGAFNASKWNKIVIAGDLSTLPYLPIAGGTLTGALTLAGDPGAALGAATKQYVDGKVPVASSTTPAMDGTAAVGVGATFARGDHVHPSDTSRYAASNPSGYQTAAQVTASLASYLPLAGGTLTGALNGTAAILSGNVVGAQIFARAPSAGAGAQFVCQDNTGAAKGQFYWDATTPAIRMFNAAAGSSAYLDGTGLFGTTGAILAATGYRCKGGASGGVRGNMFNIDFVSPNASLWVDTTNMGVFSFTSDYRVKKDVTPLPSMWERAKALKPISYTHQDYTPPNAPLKDDGGPADPLIVADDVERWGFIAHELQETLIESAATGVKDQPDAIQSPNPWTVIATLAKALQEAMTRIEALEAA